MRSIFLKQNDAIKNDELLLSDERVHHLTRVCRVRIDDIVLILDGAGTVYESTIKSIDRRNVTLLINSSKKNERKYQIDICLGIPKKEAFELVVKNCVELGISKLFTFSSTYSQWKIMNLERVEALIQSAMIQSNNPYLLEVADLAPSLINLEIDYSKYELVILTTLKEKNSLSKLSDIKRGQFLIIVGPEGGFSSDEEEFFLSLNNVATLNTMGPIMRTPNAVSTCVGFLLGKIAAS